ncbi:CMRF35-like molecule 1 [Gracilinanus agilis]|uniref:CMRF35-like molecule 1 n=1 Tax=Gracilinanus agilis TaxID=191870 RepID=UPI001CFD1980|nr:CMRF35-like molecule 1 [Gracilinanus agilis]
MLEGVLICDVKVRHRQQPVKSVMKIVPMKYEKKMYLLSTFLFLWLPGCFSSENLWSPDHVNFEENSLGTVNCSYAKGWEQYVKWWCRGANWYCEILVKTKESESVKDRVSIQDDVAAHIFTVTIKDIRKGDEDFYWCGIEKYGVDIGKRIRLTVSPVPTTVKTATNARTTNTATNARTTNVITIKSTRNITGIVNNYSNKRFKITDLQHLLPIIFGILLVMFVGASILVWRMMLKQKKEAEKLAKKQSTEEGICYANLTLQQRTSRDAPLDSPEAEASPEASNRVNSIYSEVEYVTMASLREENISYATLSLHTPDQTSIYTNMGNLNSQHHLRNPIEKN